MSPMSSPPLPTRWAHPSAREGTSDQPFSQDPFEARRHLVVSPIGSSSAESSKTMKPSSPSRAPHNRTSTTPTPSITTSAPANTNNYVSKDLINSLSQSVNTPTGMTKAPSMESGDFISSMESLTTIGSPSPQTSKRNRLQLPLSPRVIPSVPKSPHLSSMKRTTTTTTTGSVEAPSSPHASKAANVHISSPLNERVVSTASPRNTRRLSVADKGLQHDNPRVSTAGLYGESQRQKNYLQEATSPPRKRQVIESNHSSHVQQHNTGKQKWNTYHATKNGGSSESLRPQRTTQRTVGEDAVNDGSRRGRRSAANNDEREHWWTSIGKGKTTPRVKSAKPKESKQQIYQRKIDRIADLYIERTETTMSKETIQRLIKEFDSHSGTDNELEPEEFNILISHYVSNNLGNHIIKRLFELFKSMKEQKRTHGIGVVGYLKGIDRMLKGGIEDNKDFFFDLMDLNGDGNMTKNEFIKMWRNVEMAKSSPARDKETLLDGVKVAAKVFSEMCQYGGRYEKNSVIDRDLFYKLLDVPRFASWFEDLRDDLPAELKKREEAHLSTLLAQSLECQ